MLLKLLEAQLIGKCRVFVVTTINLWCAFASSLRSVPKLLSSAVILKHAFTTSPIHHSSLAYQLILRQLELFREID